MLVSGNHAPDLKDLVGKKLGYVLILHDDILDILGSMKNIVKIAIIFTHCFLLFLIWLLENV